MTTVIIVVVLSLSAGLSIAGLIWRRQRGYQRRICYDPRQDCIFGVEGAATEVISARADGQAFVAPVAAATSVSAVLEIEVRASVWGRLFDPAIEIAAGDFQDVQYLERGVRGTRFLNVSRMLRNKGQGASISLKGQGVTGLSAARLHMCRETIGGNERVLVLAPHPDDAEIAAFGLYSDTCATVVTLTAGDASDRYHNKAEPWMSLSRNDVARVRVLDSLTVPQLGGVQPERAINLCFPDGRLRDMYLQPEADFHSEGDPVDFPALRRMNRSPLLSPHQSRGNWKSLVGELAHIITAEDPTIVVTPHPKLDPHLDHLFTTLALCEALDTARTAAPRMFLYVVHNRRSELWPFGPAGSGVALLPILSDDGRCGTGFYSHALSIERQRQKLMALKAMHDLRDQQWPERGGYGQAAVRVGSALRTMAHGLGSDPTSYFRRAVRPDELFFVASSADTLAMARQAVHRQDSRQAA